MEQKPLWEVSLGLYIKMAVSYLKPLGWSAHDQATLHYASSYHFDVANLTMWVGDHVEYLLDKALDELARNPMLTQQTRSDLADEVRRLVDASEQHGIATDQVKELLGWDWSKKKQSFCDCGCCHMPDYGACDHFERGFNGRCVYCDHGEECHPGTGPWQNGPLWPVKRKSSQQ